MKNKIIKSMFNDVLINTIAFGLLTASQQLVAYPFIANKVETRVFGDILTYMAIVNIIGMIVGSQLGNARLILNEKYIEQQEKGDFKLILFIGCIISSFILFIVTYGLESLSSSLGDKIIISSISFFVCLRLYMAAENRIEGEFRGTFKQSIYYLMGLGVGLMIFQSYPKPYIPFLLGEVTSVILYYRKSKIIKEPLKRTRLLKELLSVYKNLAVTTGISYSINQLDKLIINPLLGSTSVSIYHSAGSVAKMGSVILNPINGVMLSWFGRLNVTKKKIYMYTYIGGIGIGIIYFLVSILISPKMIEILYPQYYEESIVIFGYICLVSAISITTGIHKLVIIRFGDTKNVIKVFSRYSILYVTTSIPMTMLMELKGFILVNILTNLYLFTMVSKQILKEYSKEQ